MKKRLISMLLVAVLAVSLLAGYSLSANAETVSYSTMTYQMKSGDYVLRICQRLGLNYYTCKVAIMKLNNITDNQWNKLAVGRMLTLPSTDADAIVIATGHGSTINSKTTSSTSTSAASTAAATPKATTTYTQSAIDTAISKDICWWYMVPYKLSMGETVTDACNALGISYSRWKDTIQRDNNITNWNSIPAGTTLWLPTIDRPAAGTQCYTVYRHVMQSGDTAYGVVTSRGLDYNALKPMLQTINDGRNLASYKAGESFYYPVATTIELPSDTTSNNKTITTNSDGTTTIVQTYKLTSAIDTGAAVVEFYVNGNQVREAKAGDTVNVSITTKAGRAAKNVRVKFANGQADMLLNSFSFTMPSCDIAIDADVSKGHNIEIVSNYIGKAVTLVDGVSMNAAATGAGVIVASNDPALVPTEVYVSYKTLSGLKREAVTNIDQGFVMPDADVKVEVTLEAVPTYPIYVVDQTDGAGNVINNNGTYTLQVNGNDVTRAAKGAEVTIKPKANEGYTIGGIVVQRHTTGQNVNVFNNTFIMPADAVDVQVIFQPKDNNTILINPIQGGQFYATTQANASLAPTTIANRNAWAIQEAQTNTRVYLNWVPENAADNVSYIMETRPAFADSYIVTNSKGLRIPVTIDATGVWFRMPAGGVTVTGAVRSAQRVYTGSVLLDGQAINQFQDISLYLRADSEQLRNEYQITNDGTAPQFPANVGEYVNVSYNVSSKNVALDHYEVWVNGAIDNTLTGELQKNSCFQVPTMAQVAAADAVFEVRAYFVSNTVKLAAADVKITGVGTVGMVDGATGLSVNGVKAGVPFGISVAPAQGYVFDVNGTNPAENISSIRVFRKDTGGEILLDQTIVPNPVQVLDVDGNPTGTLLFFFGPMPADGVKVEVVFEKIGYLLMVTTVDEDGDPITGGSFVKITRNNTDTVIDNLFTGMNVEYGDTIKVALTEAGASEYTFVSTEVNGFVSKNTSFKVSDDIANNPIINLIVTLKSKSLSQVKNPISLNAASTNDARGSVGCLITASPSGLSTLDGKYHDVAYAQDTVAIVPQPGTGYYTDADHVHVNVGNGEQTVTETTIDGKTAYTFTMPSKDYKNIRVEFLPIEYNLTINVIDATTNAPVSNMVKASYSSGGTDPDVLLSDSFRPVPYGSTVTVNLSGVAKSYGVTMDKTSLATMVTPGTLPVPDKEKKTVNNTVASSGDGVRFTMPAGDCTITVKLNNVPAAVGPVMVELPSTAKIVGTTKTLKLKYATEGGEIVLGGAEVESGTKLKVIVDQALDPGEKLDGPIDFLKGTNVLAQADDGAFFTVPANPDEVKDYTLTAQVKVTDKQYKVQIKVENAPADAVLSVKVGGAEAVSLPTAGMILADQVVHGTTIEIKNTGGTSPKEFTVAELSSTASADVSGPLAPADTADGATVVLTVKFEVPEYTLTDDGSSKGPVEFQDSEGNVIASGSKVPEGSKITIKGVVGDSQYVTKLAVKIAPATTYETVEAGETTITVTGDVNAYVADVANKVVSVEIKFENKPSDAEITVNGAANTKVTGITSGSNTVKVIFVGPAKYDDYKFDLANVSVSGTADGAVTNDTAPRWPTFTVDMEKVDNNDAITITLPIEAAQRTLLSETSVGTKLEYFDAAGNKINDTSVADGTEVYVKPTLADKSRYPTSFKMIDTTVSEPNSKGQYGPFKVTANLTDSNILIGTAEKVITLNFAYAGSAASKVWLYTDGTGAGIPEATNTSIKVTKSGSGGTTKLADVLLKTDGTDKFDASVVTGTNVNTTFYDGNTKATFDLVFDNLNNNASVMITVALQ